jgi:hypothetical protein
MTDTTSATVETLIAEVRTLVVGSRQVTLSVAKQLDAVPLEELDIMGRIKLGDPDNRWVIGSHHGILAIARYETRPHRYRRYFRPELLPGSILVCKYLSPNNNDGGYRLGMRLTGTEFRVEKEDVTLCCESDRSYSDHFSEFGFVACASMTPEEVWIEIEDQLAEDDAAHLRRVALHKRAAESPLIVLAGLK